ncbi:MAG: methionine adenosyltransferase [Prevotellaceae bacterium]|jgi:S-adenosylmethionine synthetase|nr:methionine adenosyltransferase [Prevotellaceae bacterium]
MSHSLFTSEAVSEGHPDKVADQISDAILDAFLRQDPESKVACETFVTTGLTVVGGEVRTRGYVDVQEVVRRVINRIGYNKAEYKFDGDSCGVLSAIHEQSADINQGVVRSDPDEQGAGDQGMVFGYATNETDEYMPLPLVLSQITLQELAAIRRGGRQMTYLRPDSKSQFTVEYDERNRPVRIHTIVVSTQHDEFVGEAAMQEQIRRDVREILLPRVVQRLPARLRSLFDDRYILHVNPTGKFVIGGPHGDTGLTGRKIIVDTYGGRGAHGGGAFSGKDASKVDRSAAYAARHIAKNLVAAGVADEALVQVAYAIGIARPVSIFVDTRGTSNVPFSDAELGEKVGELFDLRPAKIIERFGLKYPVFERTAAYGHFGRDCVKETVTLHYDNRTTTQEVVFFAWEQLDAVATIKKALRLE